MAGRLETPPFYEDLTPYQRQDMLNGCGPGKWGSRIVPDRWKIIGVDFREACNIHDYCYQTGVPKDVADKMFQNNMLTLADDAYPGMKWFASGLAFMYFLAVKHAGAGFYNKEI